MTGGASHPRRPLLSIKFPHTPVDTLSQDALDGVGGPFDGGVDGLFILPHEFPQHPVGHVVVGVGLLAHPHPQSGELVGAQVLNDIFQPVVPSCGALHPDTQPAHGQGGVVGHHQHVVGGDFVKIHRLAHRLSGEVHIGDGLHHQHLFPGNGQDIGQRLKSQPLDRLSLALRHLVGHHKAHIVPGIHILIPGIAQADQQPADAPGVLFEKHGIHLIKTGRAKARPAGSRFTGTGETRRSPYRCG